MIRVVLIVLAIDLVAEALRATSAAGVVGYLVGAALAAMLACGGGR